MAAASFFPDSLHTWRQLATYRGQSRVFVRWVHAVRLKLSAEHQWDATAAACLVRPLPTLALCLKNAAQFCPASSLSSIGEGGTSVCPSGLRSHYILVPQRRMQLITEPGKAAHVWMDLKIKGCLTLLFRVLDCITRVQRHAHRVSAAKSLLSVLCSPYVRPFPFHLIPAGCHDLSSNLHFSASLNTRYKVSETPSRTHKIVLRLHGSKN